MKKKTVVLLVIFNLEDRLISRTHSKCGGDVVINSACPGD